MQEDLMKLCQELQLPTLHKILPDLLEQTERQNKRYEEWLYDLLSHEAQERKIKRIARRLKEARFPLVKALESFDFSKSELINPLQIRTLAEGHYIQSAESIIFIGEPGTGKTHLATALGIQAIEQGTTVRFTTASELANKLIEAKNQQQLSKCVATSLRFLNSCPKIYSLTRQLFLAATVPRSLATKKSGNRSSHADLTPREAWLSRARRLVLRTSMPSRRIVEHYARYSLLIIDELGYLALTKNDAELLFQVISLRHEKKSVIITTNLPFSEWTSVFPDVRLCRALIDRITHHAQIIETGSRSVRFEEAISTTKNKKLA